jgi:hypothetical protein
MVLARRFLGSPWAGEEVWREIERRNLVRPMAPSTMDLPLSTEAKRTLLLAAEEADRVSSKKIRTQHLLLGLLRNQECVGALLLNGRGLQLAAVHPTRSRRGPWAVDCMYLWSSIYRFWQVRRQRCSRLWSAPSTNPRNEQMNTPCSLGSIEWPQRPPYLIRERVFWLLRSIYATASLLKFARAKTSRPVLNGRKSMEGRARRRGRQSRHIPGTDRTRGPAGSIRLRQRQIGPVEAFEQSITNPPASAATS